MKNHLELDLKLETEPNEMLSPQQRFRLAAELLAAVVLRAMEEENEQGNQK